MNLRQLLVRVCDLIVRHGSLDVYCIDANGNKYAVDHIYPSEMGYIALASDKTIQDKLKKKYKLQDDEKFTRDQIKAIFDEFLAHLDG